MPAEDHIINKNKHIAPHCFKTNFSIIQKGSDCTKVITFEVALLHVDELKVPSVFLKKKETKTCLFLFVMRRTPSALV